MTTNTYPIKARVKPFFRGLLSLRPFREVAVEGLRRGVSGSLAKRYAKRIACWGKTEGIHAVLAGGCCDEAQDILARGFKNKYDSRLSLFCLLIDIEPDILNRTTLENRKEEYCRETNRHANELLKSGRITSAKARRILEKEFARKDRYFEAMEDLKRGEERIAEIKQTLADN